MRTAQGYRGSKVAAIDYRGDELPGPVRARFDALRGQEFSPTALRSILLWLHENGSDSLVEVSVANTRGGVELIVSSKQKSDRERGFRRK